MNSTSQNELISIVAKYIFQKWKFLQIKLLAYMSYMCICICIYVYMCVYLYVYLYFY